jgi:hypothetical protein
LGGGILIENFDSIYGVSRETEVIHYPEHAIVVSGIESSGEVHNKGIDVFVKEFGIF